ncbi:MAG: SDR family oxidoreductase [Alphaproteobacteria bacterium]|nr:SDR family oxidoreductase [Alphaproteobacteria bacterium]
MAARKTTKSQGAKPGKDAPVALITGGGTGIGAATAKLLAAHGWNVAINYRASREEAEATAAACRKLGADATALQGDVVADGDCRRMAKQALARWGRIDGLVNNAGMTKVVAGADLEGLSAEDFHAIYATNVVGAYQMTRAAAPALKAKGNGSIVNVSSIVGIVGGGSSTAYAASKGALNTMTMALARALAPEIRVNAVCPSFVETRWVTSKMDAKQYKQVKAGVEANSPLQRICSAEDVAESVAWFIEGGRAITGEILMIDAGVHLFGLGAAYQKKK